MNNDERGPAVVPLAEMDTLLEQAGGKAASLVRLIRAGVSVPDGFCVTTGAYDHYVERSGLGDPILEAVAAADPGAPETLRSAADRVADLFRGAPVPDDVAEGIRAAYKRLGSGSAAVAVRSSATAEDLPEHSFAGQQDTYLNIQGEEALLAAVRDCWASLWTARAIGYRARAGIAPEHVSLAVVVQELVPSDAAGVAFTADPVTGARERITINAAWGLGEAVVSGEVTSDVLVVDRASGALVERSTGDKAVMTVPRSSGTAEEPVPDHLRLQEVLGDNEARELAHQCTRIEELYGTPMDIEWARHAGNLYILQARPITTALAPAPGTAGAVEAEVWNDSLAGDYLWTSVNVGEAVPSVMTPLTWSVFVHSMAMIKPLGRVPGIMQFGNIGGRLYMNVSLFTAFGSKAEAMAEQITGHLPDGVRIPPLGLSRGQLIARAAPVLLRALPSLLPYRRRTGEKLAQVPARLAAARESIHAARTPVELARCWDSEANPAFAFAARTFWACHGLGQFAFRPWLLKHGTSESDVNALSTGADPTQDESPLASLGPVVGLAQLARGEIDRQTFIERWGHRSPDEFELSVPRPAEDPDLLDRQVDEARASLDRLDSLVESQRETRREAQERFVRRHPDKAGELRRRMEASARAARFREAGRSEWVRSIGVHREFVLRAGELTGHGEDLFFLELEELLAVLRGDETALAKVPARRATYDLYRSLPTYPSFIRGRFDPQLWASDPHRRADVYEEGCTPTGSTESGIRGAPGAAGTVEGTARVVASAAEGEALAPGEILVTTVTNVGWTPLFPRAGAVVTDVGAPLSHAAIVARELGIPAVVGCGDATTRIATGDRIRVDGSRGTVEIVASADTAAVPPA
ncbi:PEP/pyruvate-binding domain-containing protein [Nocardiopsis nanhaiensis]